MNDAPSSRDAMLGAIRKALGVSGDDASRRNAVEKRITRHPANLVPMRAQQGPGENIALLTTMLEGQGAKVSRAAALSEVPGIVASYLREHNLPAEFRTGADPLLGEIPWQDEPVLSRHSGRGQGDDAVTMSHATVAAAETGTLFLTSGPENPTTLNFLPDTHIAMLKTADIAGSYEDAWNRLREIFGERNLPRAVNLISGPSRTADIEQIIVMGAHGPRRLHVILID
jgi:L-lactate dehydrogenase complex protein LldG